jgi:hypothetical protein
VRPDPKSLPIRTSDGFRLSDGSSACAIGVPTLLQGLDLNTIASLFCQPDAGLGLRALCLADQRRLLGLELLNLSFKPLAIPRLLFRRRLVGLIGLIG